MTVPVVKGGAITAERLAYISLMREIEDFLNLEADLIDGRSFSEWLALFSDDLRYWMPMRKNLAYRDRNEDITAKGDIAWFDDDKLTLTQRVRQIQTGVHWAEEPLSRVTHLVSNIRLAELVSSLEEGEEATVHLHFLVHRNRLERETDFMAGRREDKLRRTLDSFLICERSIFIDQSVLLAKNLTFFF